MSQNVDQRSEDITDSRKDNKVKLKMAMHIVHKKSGVGVCVCERERERGQTGRPTATLRSEILLIPALKFTPSLNVSFGFSRLP